MVWVLFYWIHRNASSIIPLSVNAYNALYSFVGDKYKDFFLSGEGKEKKMFQKRCSYLENKHYNILKRAP